MDRLRTMMEAASPDFREANALHGAISDRLVNPVAAGPLGSISRTSDIGAQGHALIPAVPSEGAPSDAAAAVALMARHDSTAAAQIVRNRLASQFRESTQANMGGPNQWGGAKFAAEMAGNSLQERSLNAAVGALPPRGFAPGPAPVQQLADLLDVLRATGMRKPQGSATEFNRQVAAQLRTRGFPRLQLKRP